MFLVHSISVDATAQPVEGERERDTLWNARGIGIKEHLRALAYTGVIAGAYAFTQGIEYDLPRLHIYGSQGRVWSVNTPAINNAIAADLGRVAAALETGDYDLSGHNGFKALFMHSSLPATPPENPLEWPTFSDVRPEVLRSAMKEHAGQRIRFASMSRPIKLAFGELYDLEGYRSASTRSINNVFPHELGRMPIGVRRVIGIRGLWGAHLVKAVPVVFMGFMGGFFLGRLVPFLHDRDYRGRGRVAGALATYVTGALAASYMYRIPVRRSFRSPLVLAITAYEILNNWND